MTTTYTYMDEIHLSANEGGTLSVKLQAKISYTRGSGWRYASEYEGGDPPEEDTLEVEEIWVQVDVDKWMEVLPVSPMFGILSTLIDEEVFDGRSPESLGCFEGWGAP